MGTTGVDAERCQHPTEHALATLSGISSHSCELTTAALLLRFNPQLLVCSDPRCSLAATHVDRTLPVLAPNSSTALGAVCYRCTAQVSGTRTHTKRLIYLLCAHLNQHEPNLYSIRLIVVTYNICPWPSLAPIPGLMCPK